jgi:hypothetical protein
LKKNLKKLLQHNGDKDLALESLIKDAEKKNIRKVEKQKNYL